MSSQPETKEKEFAFSDKEFRFLAQLANAKTGIKLPDHKRDMVYNRLTKRLRQLNMTSFKEYCEFMKQPEGADEVTNLVNAITTNLTHLFREVHHFEHLRDTLLASLQKSGTRKLRIWSAGCSSGMEPYSIAMTLKDTLKNIEGWDARILASDIDTNMLDRGMKGIYPADQYKNIPKEYQHNATCQGNEVHMDAALKKLIAFKQLNLLEQWPMKGKFDAIFCRNVVIYFDQETQQKLFARMAQLISPNGFLYIGHSENITRITDEFELIGRTIYKPVV